MKVPMQPDYTDSVALSKSMLEQADLIGGMAPVVAKARTVLEYSGDRKKMALAVAFKSAKQAGATSATEAEHMARASAEYEMALARLETQDLSAEQAVAAWEASKIKYEALRSAVALNRAVAQIL